MTSPQWLQFLLSYAMQASIVLGAAWLLDACARSSHEKMRVWTACFVSLLALLAAGMFFPRLHLVHPWSGLSRDAILAVANFEFVLGRLLLLVWLLGVSAMGIRWLIQFFRVKSLIESCPVLPPDESEFLCSQTDPTLLAPQGRDVEFRVCPEVLGPFCYQFHRPQVILPGSIIRGDCVELRHVLTHELTHLQTQHPLQLFLQRSVQCVLWFHPLVWAAGRRASLVREFVCDDAAGRDLASVASYLQTLLRIVQQRTDAPNSALAIGRTTSELRLRASRLVSTRRSCRAGSSSLAAAAVLATACVVSQLWLPTDPLVSPRTVRAPWPTWSAEALHAFNIQVRDFQSFDSRSQLHELEFE